MYEQQKFKTAISQKNINQIKFYLKSEEISLSESENHPIRIAVMSGCVKTLSLLLNDKRANLKNQRINILYMAATEGYFEITKLLLNHPDINPTAERNYIIQHVKNYNKLNTLSLLWNDNRVKSTLQKDNLELYNELMSEEVQQKLCEF